MPLQYKRLAECVILALALSAVMGIAGCREFFGAALDDPALAAADAKVGMKHASSAQSPAESGAATLSTGDRAVLARVADRDSKGRNRSVWVRNVDQEADFRWHYSKLDEILARPPERQPDFHGLLTDPDPNVAINSAMVLARAGDGAGKERLFEAAQSPELPLPVRCAAVEALANLRDPKALELLKVLLEQYGRYGKDVKASYISELHAELIRGLARHESPAGNPAFIDALRSPQAEVRLEALKAYEQSRESAAHRSC